MSVVAEDILGTGSLITKGTESIGLAGRQTLSMPEIYTTLGIGIKLVRPFALQFYGLAS